MIEYSHSVSNTLSINLTALFTYFARTLKSAVVSLLVSRRVFSVKRIFKAAPMPCTYRDSQ